MAKVNISFLPFWMIVKQGQNWQESNGKNWQNTQQNTRDLNQQQTNRDRGNKRTNNFNQMNGGGRGSGGGSRRK